jgi:hypothetical protein
MDTKDFIRLGIPLGEATRRAADFVAQYVLRGGDTAKLEDEIKAIVASPALFAEDPLRKELAKAIVNAPPPPRAEPVKYRRWGEGLEHEAVMQMEKACLLRRTVDGALSSRRGFGSDFGQQLFDFALEPAHLFQRALRKNGKLFGLARQQFLPQRGECFAHPFQLLDGLSQNRLRFIHKRTRSNPFLSSGASRTRPKNSTYVLYSPLSRSATTTSKPNRRRSSGRDTSAYSDIGKSRSKLCPACRIAIRSMSFGWPLDVTKLPSMISSSNKPLSCIARTSSSRRAKSWGRRSEPLKTPNRTRTSCNSQSKSPWGSNPSEFNSGIGIWANPVLTEDTMDRTSLSRNTVSKA